MRRKIPYKRKAKPCKVCKKPRILWSGGMCKYCAQGSANLKAQKLGKQSKKQAASGGKVVTNYDKICDKEIVKATDRELDQVFSWLVRTLYPNKCHACGKAFLYSQLECCHMVDRDEKSVRWDLRNCFPGCKKCNHSDQFHVVGLARSCDEYYGKGMAEALHAGAKKTTKTYWPSDLRLETYIIFVEALAEAEKKGADKNAIRLRVLAQTKRIL